MNGILYVITKILEITNLPLSWIPENWLIEEIVGDTVDRVANKAEKTKGGKKVIEGYNKVIDKIFGMIFDCLLFMCTGGLWGIWMIIRHYKNNKKA